MVIYLAAVSNDPMGKKFEKATVEINQDAALKLAEKAKVKGVRKFIYASSCSVYGAASGLCNEGSTLNPITTYADESLHRETTTISSFE